VLAALANAKAQEQAAEERTLTNAVLKHLKMPAPQGDMSQWPVWQQWCEKSNVAPFPALPAAIAVFVLNNAALGDRLEKIIGSIGAVHEADGRANPVLSPIVIEALDQVLPRIKPPPRSWDAAHKALWQRLPRDVATYIGKRQSDHDNEIQRLQREYAALRKELTNGNTQQESTAAASADRTDAGAEAA
jgi:hypothetical protein